MSTAQQMCDECRQPVVVAETDLVVGDGVVLVHYRDHTELQQARERVTGVQVTLAVGEIEGRQEHLAREQALGGQSVLVDAHDGAVGRSPTTPGASSGRSGTRPAAPSPRRRP